MAAKRSRESTWGKDPMTRAEIVLKALNKELTWIQAAQILGITDRHMRRLKEKYIVHGFGGLRDCGAGRVRRSRIATSTIAQLCELRKREGYKDMSVQHFWEHVTEKHALKLSYNWTRLVLQKAALAEKAPARGKYRRKRERRPMTGMLLHIDASTHEWIEGQKADLIIVLDDADGRVLFARFFRQEGNESTLSALEAVLKQKGRFCELYHDRGSHYGKAESAGTATPSGQVQRVLKALNIKQIFARSPEARGRSERCFGTWQGRLPQELKLHGIKDYTAANAYLDAYFTEDFNRRFTEKSAQDGTAFIAVVGLDLSLLVSEQHERVVDNVNVVRFNNTHLQLPMPRDRATYRGLPVLVHELLDGNLVVSLQGREIARFNRDGELLANSRVKRKAS
jgi:hypothetical protein